MSFCGWSSGEKYKDHFEPGERKRNRITHETCVSVIGIYVCSECGYELFRSTKKFEHTSPWPAFTETVRPDSVSKYEESPSALKVSCGKCGNGLGHEFLNDGPKSGQSRF